LTSARYIQNNARNADALAQGSTASASVSSTAYDTKKTNIRTALTDLNAAVNNVDAKVLSISATKASNAAALTAAQTKVNSSQTALVTAEADVISAKEQLALKRAPLREVDKSVYLAAIDAAQADLDLARRRLEEATLSAPKAGIIGTMDVVTGELSGPTNRAVSMISTEYEVEAEVSELDIRKIAVGLPVELAFDALGSTKYFGKIAEIGAREIKKDDDIFYKITATLDDASLPLKPGMTAEMTMRIGEQADALLIPKRLLIKRAGKTSVRAYINEEVAEIPVRVGLEGDDDVQILEGLRDGDRIVESIQ
jgi:multidrug resistance efflux pump